MKSLAFYISLLISISCMSQSKWHPYIGLHVSADAELYYIGPSLQIGTDYKIKKHLTLTCYFHSFPNNVNRNYSNGNFEKGKYRSITGALLLQTDLNKKENKGLFLGGGIAIQKSTDNYKTLSYEWIEKRTIIVPSIRFGYTFPIQQKKITIELNTTGPYSYKIEEYGAIIHGLEVLTQLSIGTRLIF